jgi:hypothetical protein
VSITNPTNHVEIITSVQWRRRWTASEKVRMVEETFKPACPRAAFKAFFIGSGALIACPASASDVKRRFVTTIIPNRGDGSLVCESFFRCIRGLSSFQTFIDGRTWRGCFRSTPAETRRRGCKSETGTMEPVSVSMGRQSPVTGSRASH